MINSAFHCPHCKAPASTSDIVCGECGRQMRNAPRTAATAAANRAQKINITILLAIFVVVMSVTVVNVLVLINHR